MTSCVSAVTVTACRTNIRHLTLVRGTVTCQLGPLQGRDLPMRLAAPRTNDRYQASASQLAAVHAALNGRLQVKDDQVKELVSCMHTLRKVAARARVHPTAT